MEKYILSLPIGEFYSLPDISLNILGDQLTIKGSNERSNFQSFEKILFIPKNVKIETIFTTLSNGVLTLTFDHINPSEIIDFQNLSTDKEFKIIASLRGYKKEETKILIENRELIIEGTQKLTNCENSDEKTFSKYITRRICLTDDVDTEKLQVNVLDDYVEAYAPKENIFFTRSPNNSQFKINEKI